MACTCVLFSVFVGLIIETAFSIPIGRHETLEHEITKRNFVPNRFDIVDNEIKHAIQKEVQNALRKNFVPNNPLMEASKWGRSSSSLYPENQPTMIYGLEYDQINPSRSDPGYLVLDLKKLAQGHLKFHEQQLGNRKRKGKSKAAQKPQQHNNPGQYQQNFNDNSHQPNYQNQQQPNYKNYQQPNYQNYQQPNYQNYQQPNYQNYQQPNYQSYQQPNYQSDQQLNYQNYQQPNNKNYQPQYAVQG